MSQNKNAQQSADTLLKVDHVKYRKAGPGKSPLGTLCIHDDRIQWGSEAEKDDELVVPFSKVKGQRISPPNKPKVQLQLCMFNDDQATFVFMNPAHSQEQLVAERDLVKEMLQQALVRHRQLVNQMAQQSAKGGSEREREAKQQILQQNAHLLDMYKHLVASKLITPSDFWSFHYKTDGGKGGETSGGGTGGGIEPQQRVGVSGGFLSSIVHSEGINGIRLNLTAETIQAIFRTYPAVEQKHLELVPHELSEQEFWTRFFQSHYFHRQRNTPADVPSTSKAAGSGTTTTALDDPFADCAKMDEKDMANLIAKGQRTLKRHLDLSYIDEDLGILSEMRSARISVRGSSVAKRLLVRRCNYHSERVLETTMAEVDNDSAAGRTRHDPMAPNGNALNENGCATETGQNEQNDDDNGRHSSEEYQLELESNELAELDNVRPAYCPLAAYNVPKHCAAPPTDEQMTRAKTALTDALQRSGSVLEENNQIAFFDLLTAHHLDDIDEEIERAEAKTAVSVNFKELSKPDTEQVRVVHACLAELLRHFWHCFPARTPELEQKIVRMNETLTKFEQTQLMDGERQFGQIYFQQCRAQLSLARRRFLAFQNAAATRRPKK
ncbi:hypothetical protein niasHT_002593 [Heterodera trifolii]|uniref:BSD domain-containing protein n=1 Tax=Heterodera trifolii TaxID=157864 RepID=A0ABD2M0C9_9BILA